MLRAARSTTSLVGQTGAPRTDRFFGKQSRRRPPASQHLRVKSAENVGPGLYTPSAAMERAGVQDCATVGGNALGSLATAGFRIVGALSVQ